MQSLQHHHLTNQAAIIALFRVINRYVGNLPPMPWRISRFSGARGAVTPRAGRELGMSCAGECRRRRAAGGAPVTNIRNTSSPHWRGWLSAPNTAAWSRRTASPNFAPERSSRHRQEEGHRPGLRGAQARPLFSFAGIWTEFRGDRGPKSKADPLGPHLVYGSPDHGG